VALGATAAEALLFAWDGEDGRVPVDTFGALVDGPERVGSRACLAGQQVPDSPLVRVMLKDAAGGLFAYRDDAVLTFSYWAEARVGALSVYLWDATRQASLGAALIAPPELVPRRWCRATVRLAEFRAAAERLVAGDVVTELTVQTGTSGGAMYVDDVRVVVRP
jgi:hypothetical protein